MIHSGDPSPARSRGRVRRLRPDAVDKGGSCAADLEPTWMEDVGIFDGDTDITDRGRYI